VRACECVCVCKLDKENVNLVNLKFELVFLQSICLRVRACVCVSVREKECRFSEYVCDVSLVVWVCLRDYNYKCVLSKY
jgi:hypothetical protein